MSAGASSIHGMFSQRWAIPKEPTAPQRQRKERGQFENVLNAKQNQMMEETIGKKLDLRNLKELQILLLIQLIQKKLLLVY